MVKWRKRKKKKEKKEVSPVIFFTNGIFRVLNGEKGRKKGKKEVLRKNELAKRHSIFDYNKHDTTFCTRFVVFTRYMRSAAIVCRRRRRRQKVCLCRRLFLRDSLPFDFAGGRPRRRLRLLVGER